MAKKKKRIEVRKVDPNKAIGTDLRRVGLWAGISVGVTAVVAVVVRSFT